MNRSNLAQMSARHALRKKIQPLIKGQRELATLWGFVQEVKEVTSRRNSGAKDLAQVISSDAVIATKLLRIVSSSAFGFSSKVADLDKAIVLLGNKAVVDLCTGISAVHCLSGINRKFDRVALWQHSLATAVVSQTLHTALFKKPAPELFTAGLLCNIGRICIDQLMPHEFDLILDLTEEMPMLEAELKILGATHAEIGAWVAQSWNIDPRLCRVMEQHHGPVDSDPWPMVVNLAYVYVDALGVGSPVETRLTELAPGGLDLLGIDTAMLKKLIPQMNDAIVAAEPMFEIMVESYPAHRDASMGTVICNI